MHEVRGTLSLACACWCLLVAPAWGSDAFDDRLQHAGEFAQQQLGRTASSLAPTAYPKQTGPGGAWRTTSAYDWNSGFLPGNFWLAYELGGAAAQRSRAQSWQAGVEVRKSDTSTHDLGFVIFNSFGNGFRLTGDPDDRQVVLAAATSLATRFSPAVGSVRSWDTATDFRVIVDNTMNLELLLWGARNGGNPAWRDMAISHALHSRADLVRPDGSTYHVVDYDESTGAVRRKLTHQGYATASTWARGQAWAVHGFTTLYRETGDTRFLDTARRTSDWYLAHLPADRVPFWDFDAPGIPAEPRDSSAAAVAASGLLELARLEPDPGRAAGYRTAGEATLSSLTGSGYLAEGTANAAVLVHGTYNKPDDDFDSGLIWGDHYLLEALLRERLLPPRQAALPVLAARASADDGNPAGNAIDGDAGTRWSASGDGQWLELDLGGVEDIAKVTLAFAGGERRATRLEVQTSVDRVSWTTRLSTLSSGRTDAPEALDFPDAAGRYVRIVGHGTSTDTVNAISEAGVYAGAVVDDATPPPFELRLSRSSSRSNPLDLDGRTVTGRIYVFVKPDAGVSRVDFSLDGEPWHSEFSAPWDFVGGSRTRATSFDTATIEPGTHTIGAVIARPGDAPVALSARFTVA